MSLKTQKSRSEIAVEDQWDLTPLYPDFTAWNIEFQATQKNSSNTLWGFLDYKGRLGESVELFKKALVERLLLERKLEKLYTYAHLRHDENITDSASKSAFEKISFLISQFHQESAWFEPELLALPEATLNAYLQHDTLKKYQIYLKKIYRARPHTLSADIERVLAMAAKPLGSLPKVFSSLNNADIRFSPVKDSQGVEHPLTHGLYQLYLRSPDRVLRENAFKEMQGKFGSLENSLTDLIAGQVEKHYFQARVRNFPSSLAAALFPNNVPSTVYHQLVRSVKSNLGILHKYISLRKKVLKLSEIHFYDMYAPLVQEFEMHIPYKEAEEMVIASVAPLGKEYQELLRRGLESERWVDRYENINKRSGAYSSGCYDSHPYILMNYRGTLRDLFTLAHEAGHSMHSLLSKKQEYHDASYPIFVAEVASTFNEELLMEYLLQKAKTPQEKLFLINEKMEDIRGTLLRQTMFAEFELLIHELIEKENPLTPQILKESYFNLNREYFGPEMTYDTEIAVEWARIPHFYYNFYVYQYATGISAALALSEKVLNKEAHSVEKYLHFLQQGGSAFPIDLLKNAGVDMTTSQPVEAALKKFDRLIDQFTSLI